MFIRCVILSVLLLPLWAQATVVSKHIQYTVDGQAFTGFLAYDDALGKQPGILIVHEWWGHDAHVRKRALELAKQGYTAFAMDLYGTGKYAENPDDAKRYMEAAFTEPQTSEKRFNAALAILKKQPMTDDDHVAVIGYGLGGAIALHMARIGTEVDAVISFYGSLASRLPYGEKPEIQSFIQIYTGGLDRMVPSVQVADFTQEMVEAQADFNLQVYKGIRHAFANRSADAIATRFRLPLAYDHKADLESWQHMLQLLARLFATSAS